MATVAECLRQAEVLVGVCDQPLREAQALLGHCTGKTLADIYTWPEAQVSTQQSDQFLALMARRADGVPVAYLTGVKDFWSLSLTVEEGVLVPRPETELLVEAALARAQQTSGKLLDLGTGTGAIALAFGADKSDWQVIGVDQNPQAVALAKRNAKTNSINNVRFSHSDWFTAVDGRYDLIVSNPPYIDSAAPELNGDGVKHEPLDALVAPEKGMADIKHIVMHAKSYLKPSGWLLIEHGYDQGAASREVLQACSYNNVETVQDYAGHDRVSLGQML